MAAVESGDDESLNKNMTVCFVKKTSHLFNSARVEKTCSSSVGHMLSHFLVCSLAENRGHESNRMVEFSIVIQY